MYYIHPIIIEVLYVSRHQNVANENTIANWYIYSIFLYIRILTHIANIPRGYMYGSLVDTKTLRDITDIPN